MVRSNDNNRPVEIYDDEGFKFIEEARDFAFLGVLKKKRPAATMGFLLDAVKYPRHHADYRSLANFLWFAKFEKHCRENEAQIKRQQLKDLNQ